MAVNYFGKIQVYNADPTDTGASGYSDVLFDGQFVYYCPFDEDGESGVVLRYNTEKPFKDPSAWSIYDAGNTDGLNTKSYFGLVFDGRFLYFVPASCKDEPHAHCRVLRYDTQSPFKSAESWAAYDAEGTDGMVCRGYRGGVFDGRYVYFVPYMNDDFFGFHSVFLRYDIEMPFKDPAAWSAYDAGGVGGGPNKGYWGGVKSGEYIYFSPYNRITNNGRVLRYNISMPFKDADSWSVMDLEAIDANCVNLGTPAADERYVYFPPGQWVWVETFAPENLALCIARYDKELPFEDPAAWEILDLRDLEPYPQAHASCYFYGQYVLFGPYTNDLLAYNTELPFKDPTAWTVRDVANSDGEMESYGYRGVAADDLYFYFAPYDNDAIGWHSLAMRCRVSPCCNQVAHMPGDEDLTKYYVHSPGPESWEITNSKVIVTNAALGYDHYLYRCYGYRAFESFEVDFYVKLISASYQAIPEARTIKHGTLCFSNRRHGQRKSLSDDDLAVQLRADFLSGVMQACYIQLDRLDGGEGSRYEIALDTVYYCTLLRESGTVTLKIYSDAERTSLLATLTQSGFESSWRFIYATRGAGEPTEEENACSYECGDVVVSS
jgi:hypothetical protein